MYIQWKIDRFKTSVSPAMEGVVDRVIQLMKQDGDPKFSVPSNQPKNLMKLRDHIRVIMCNLICAEQTDPNLWISFLNGHGHLKKNPSLKGFQFSIRNVNKVVGFLEKHGFIQIQKGYAPPKGEKGCKPEASKMKATAKLQEALAYKPNELVIFRDTTHVELIRMKGERLKRKVKQKDGTFKWEKYRNIVQMPRGLKVEAEQLSDNLRTINKVIEQAHITLDIDQHGFQELNRILSHKDDEYKRPIDLTRKSLHRVFHDKRLDRHGRFYGCWCAGIPEEYREKILINGMPVAELDFSELHPSMLYCLDGLAIPEGDLYLLPDKPTDKPFRKFFKQILLTMINASGDQSTIGAVRKEWNKKKARAKRDGEPIPDPPYPLEDSILLEIIGKIREKHNAIQHYFDQDGIGNILMNHDSQIAEKVMLHFANKGISCLPIHDSFLVPLPYARECVAVMKSAFKEQLGQAIEIDGSLLQGILNAIDRNTERTPEILSIVHKEALDLTRALAELLPDSKPILHAIEELLNNDPL